MLHFELDQRTVVWKLLQSCDVSSFAGHLKCTLLLVAQPLDLQVFVFSCAVYVVFDSVLSLLPSTFSFYFEVVPFHCLFLIQCHLIQLSQDFHMSDLLQLIQLSLLGKDTFVLLEISFSCKSFDNILSMLERLRVLPLDVVSGLLHQVL